ncbi:MAG: hypothetical protein ACLQGV_14295 [Bryobacteraceae bacterium]
MNFLKRLFGRPTEEQTALAGVLLTYLQFRLDGRGCLPPAEAARRALHIYPREDVIEMLGSAIHPRNSQRLVEGHPFEEQVRRLEELGKALDELRTEHQNR